MQTLKPLLLVLCMFFLVGCGGRTIVAVLEEDIIGDNDVHILVARTKTEDPFDVGSVIAQAFMKYGVSAEVIDLAKAQARTGSGTGFVITEGYWITNYHVVDGLESVEVVFGGRSYPAEVIDYDTNLDLALLKAPTTGLKPFKIGQAKIGQNIYALGYPLTNFLGTSLRMTSGIVSSLHGLGGEEKNIQISAPIQPGNSGGPIVAEDDWALSGVAVASLSPIGSGLLMKGTIPQGVNFAVSPNYLKGLLMQNGISQKGPFVDSMDDAIASTGFIWDGPITERQRCYLVDYHSKDEWYYGRPHIRYLKMNFHRGEDAVISMMAETFISPEYAFGLEYSVDALVKEILKKIKIGNFKNSSAPKNIQKK